MRRSSAAKRVWESAAPTFAALGDATRLHVVARLSEEGPLSLAKLTENTHVTRQAVTKHLRVLESAGLVVSEREGRETIWTLEPKGIEDASRLLDEISLGWDARIERLKALVES